MQPNRPAGCCYDAEDDSAMMTRFSSPLLLVALAAGLIAFVVQSGELGTSDTEHRLQAAHALWTSQPPVLPEEYPEFGVHGRGGRLQSWYGIGQSLLMLPADIVGTGVEKLPFLAGYEGDPGVRMIVVSYLTNIVIAVLTALVCFRILRQFGFATGQAVAGRGRRSCVAAVHNASALHAEPDGEQLHLSADGNGVFV